MSGPYLAGRHLTNQLALIGIAEGQLPLKLELARAEA